MKKFNAEDMMWISDNLPLMKVCEKGTLLRGKYCFTNVTYLINNQNVTLSGSYEVEMSVLENDTPYVLETGGYLLSLANSKDISLGGMHVYSGEEQNKKIHACLGNPWTIRKEKSVKNIFNNLIKPYFWFYTYFDKYGQKPWGDLKHDVGLLQDYVNHQDVDVISYIELVPNNEAFRKIVQQHNILDKGPCLCWEHKTPCDCGGMEGFHLLQEEFRYACQYIQGSSLRKIGRNERCRCGDMKTKKCTCGKMENMQKWRENHSSYNDRIKACQSRANQQGESKETFAKHTPS